VHYLALCYETIILIIMNCSFFTSLIIFDVFGLNEMR